MTLRGGDTDGSGVVGGDDPFCRIALFWLREYRLVGVSRAKRGADDG